MCAVKPFNTFEVSGARIEKVLAALKASMNKLTDAQKLEVAYEVGLADGITFDPDGIEAPEMNLTDLQLVAFVAAIAAVAESGGKQVVT